MFQRLLTAARGPFAALLIASAIPGFAPAAFAEDPKPAEKPAGQEPAKEPQKVDEFAEAQKEIAGPAGNPECVWLGRRVVGLLWRDDLDTAFRHLDLYDRFGCPSAHVQASFRCLILHGNGNVLQRTLGAGEKILIEPGGFLYKDSAVQMQAVQMPLKTGLMRHGMYLAEMTGPGRVGIQSMYVHHHASE